jgi:hypothetical protein
MELYNDLQFLIMKYIITEEQYKKLNRSSQSISNAIIKYINQYIENGKRKVTPKARNFGNLREDWCVDGKETITAIYYFEDGRFNQGYLMVSKSLVEVLSTALSIRKSYVLHVILEWYDETMVPKFEQIVGESGLSIEEISAFDRDPECIPEPEKPEGITDEEMIDFIVKNTLYKEEDVIETIESGEESLEDLFLHIVDLQNKERILRF